MSKKQDRKERITGMKITVRIFKSNIKNCLPCFISSILVSATLFLFEGIKAMFFDDMSEREIMDSSLGISAHLYIYVLLFISMILTLYTVNHYSRTRIRDYGMFMVLGSEKKDIFQMVLAEYGMISVISYVIGSILGTVLLFSVRQMVLSQGLYIRLTGGMYGKAILKTFVCMLVLYAASVFMNAVSLRSNSLSSLMRYDKKKSRFPSVRAGAAGTVCAALCFIIAVAIMANENIVPYVKMKYGLLSVLGGLFLCFTYTGTLVLHLLKNRQRWYYRNLLIIKNMYYRFADNKNIMLLGFMIDFAVLIFINVNVVSYGNTTSRYLWKYPYDHVFAVDGSQEDGLLFELKKTGGRVWTYPCISLTCMEGGEYIGIPVSAFNRLAGKEEELSEGEIIAVLQKHEQDEDTLFPSGRICLDTSEGVRWFDVKEEMKEVLFVAQQRESIGIVVLNETDYDSAEKIFGGMTLVTQSLKENGKGCEEYMKEQAKAFGAALFYSKEELMLRDRKEDIMSFIFYICMGIYLMAGNMAVLAVKVWSEISPMSDKYGFLEKLGMDEKDIKRYVKSELSICMKIPFILSFVLGMGALVLISGGSEDMMNRQVLLLFAVLALIQVLSIAAMERYGCHLIADGTQRNEVRLWS